MKTNAPFSKKKSVDCSCWGSVVGRGNDLETRFLSSGQVAEAGRSKDSGSQFWEEFFRDFERCESGLLRSGEAMAQDSDGTLWTSTLLFGKADLKELCESWGSNRTKLARRAKFARGAWPIGGWSWTAACRTLTSVVVQGGGRQKLL